MRGIRLGWLVGLSVTVLARAETGDLDVLFGTHGQAQIPGQVDSASLVELPDGRILVFGVPRDSQARGAGAIAVARLLANGTPDASFGPSGHLDVGLGSESMPVPTDALLLADGRILVAGYFAGDEVGPWPDDQRRSRAPGWLVRLLSNGQIDPTFGVSGIARGGEFGVERIALLGDAAIAAASPGYVYRLDASGVPAPFPGSELLAAPVGGSYRPSTLVRLHDESLLTSGGFSSPFDSMEVSRVLPSGEVVRGSEGEALIGTFTEIGSIAPDRDEARHIVCGSTGSEVLVQRWHDDGSPDLAFAAATAGGVRLGVESRPDFRVENWRAARCRAVLPGAAGDQFIVGDWSAPYDYGGGRILLSHLDAAGAIDRALDPSGGGRELILGTAGQWSSWHVTDATLTSDGAVLLIARRSSKLDPNDFYTVDKPDNEPSVIARVMVASSSGAGSIGFNDSAVRIAERQPGELRVHRSGGSDGQVSVRYELLYDSATEEDISLASSTLTWPAGDGSARAISLIPVDDTATEGEERFRIRLSEATGGASLGSAEIEVTIEDDEALLALQFAESALQIEEGGSANLVITRPASTPGPIVVRLALAPDLDPNDGSPRPADRSRIAPQSVTELRWSGDDTSSRTIPIFTFGSSVTEPDSKSYAALADVSGTLRDGIDWKFARITVVDGPAPPAPPPPPSNTGSGGGGAISWAELAALLFAMTCVWARRLCAAIRRAVRVDYGDSL